MQSPCPDSVVFVGCMLHIIINHLVNIVNDYPAHTPISPPSAGHTEKKPPVRNVSIIIIIRIGTVGRQQPIATQFLRFGIILVFVIIIIISSVYVYVYRCKIGNKNSIKKK